MTVTPSVGASPELWTRIVYVVVFAWTPRRSSCSGSGSVLATRSAWTGVCRDAEPGCDVWPLAVETLVDPSKVGRSVGSSLVYAVAATTRSSVPTGNASAAGRTTRPDVTSAPAGRSDTFSHTHREKPSGGVQRRLGAPTGTRGAHCPAFGTAVRVRLGSGSPAAYSTGTPRKSAETKVTSSGTRAVTLRLNLPAPLSFPTDRS